MQTAQPLRHPRSRAAIGLTVLAVTVLNVAAAYLLARAVGAPRVALLDAAAWPLLVVGLLAAAGAALVFRRHVRERARGAPDG